MLLTGQYLILRVPVLACSLGVFALFLTSGILFTFSACITTAAAIPLLPTLLLLLRNVSILVLLTFFILLHLFVFVSMPFLLQVTRHCTVAIQV